MIRGRNLDPSDAASWKLFEASLAGAQTTGTLKYKWVVPFNGKIKDIRAHLNTAPAGQAFIIDVNKNGTTVFTTQANRPTIAAGANDSTTYLPDVVDVKAGDKLSLDIDQVGSTTAGSDLSVSISISVNTI
jgi:hypothetical protein